MSYKFLRGDAVRHIGRPEHLLVEKVDSEGLMYMLKDSETVVPTIEWVPEDRLELVKRAGDDETGIKLWYVT